MSEHSPQVGSVLNASIVTGEAEFYPAGSVHGIKFGNITMHKLNPKTETKERVVSVRGGGRRLASRMVTLASLVYGMTLDEQTRENLEILLWGTSTVDGLNQSLVTAPAGTKSITAAHHRKVYDLGKLDVNNVVVKDTATPTPTTFTVGTDYTVDAMLGTIYIVDGGTIPDVAGAGTDLAITFGCSALKMDSITALNTLNRRGTIRILETDDNSTTIAKKLISGDCQIYPSAFPEENADFSKFDFEVVFTVAPTFYIRQTVATL